MWPQRQPPVCIADFGFGFAFVFVAFAMGAGLVLTAGPSSHYSVAANVDQAGLVRAAFHRKRQPAPGTG
jgi:hypothetical protein